MPRAPRQPVPAPDQVVPRLLTWFARHARDLPWRHTTDPYAVWIAEVMLQQTQVATVIPYWRRWMSVLPDIATLANAPTADILKLWEGLGYYSRARHLQSAARRILSEFQGSFPDSLPALLDLPGIGRYTAGAIASTAFNSPAPILDGNVIRVLTRLHALPGNPRDRTLNSHLWDLAISLVQNAGSIPQHSVPTPAPPIRLAGPCSQLNQALMELGATTCTPRAPACLSCPLTDLCLAHAGGDPTRFPQTPPRPVITPRHLATVLWCHRRRWLVRRRPDDAVNGGYWEFPNLEFSPDQDPATTLARWLQLDPDHLQPAGTLRHSITRYRFTQHLFHLKSTRGSRDHETPSPPLLPGSSRGHETPSPPSPLPRGSRGHETPSPPSPLPRGSRGHETPSPSPAAEWRWVSPAELAQLPLTAAHRRIVSRLLPPIA